MALYFWRFFSQTAFMNDGSSISKRIEFLVFSRHFTSVFLKKSFAWNVNCFSSYRLILHGFSYTFKFCLSSWKFSIFQIKKVIIQLYPNTQNSAYQQFLNQSFLLLHQFHGKVTFPMFRKCSTWNHYFVKFGWFSTCKELGTL